MANDSVRIELTAGYAVEISQHEGPTYELTTYHDHDVMPSLSRRLTPAEAVELSEVVGVPEAEAERIREEAHTEGYVDGYAVGFENGDAGEAEVKRLQAELDEALTLMESALGVGGGS